MMRSTRAADLVAKWMFLASTVLTSADGIIAVTRSDYLTGTLGIAAALASAAGAIASDNAARLKTESLKAESMADPAPANHNFP